MAFSFADCYSNATPSLFFSSLRNLPPPPATHHLPLTNSNPLLLLHFCHPRISSPRGRVQKLRPCLKVAAAKANGGTTDAAAAASGSGSGSEVKPRGRRRKAKEGAEVGVGLEHEVLSRLSPSDAESSGENSLSGEEAFQGRQKPREGGAKLDQAMGSKELGKPRASKKDKGESMQEFKDGVKAKNEQNLEEAGVVSVKEGQKTEESMAGVILPKRAAGSRRKARALKQELAEKLKKDETAKDEAKTVKRGGRARVSEATAQASGDLILSDTEQRKIEGVESNAEASINQNGDVREPMENGNRTMSEYEKQTGKTTEFSRVKRRSKRSKAKPSTSESESDILPVNIESQIIEEVGLSEMPLSISVKTDSIEEAVKKPHEDSEGCGNAHTEAHDNAKASNAKQRKKNGNLDSFQLKIPAPGVKDSTESLTTTDFQELDDSCETLTTQEAMKNSAPKTLKATRDQKCVVIWRVDVEAEYGHRLYLTGANPELGSWDPSSAVPLVEISVSKNNKQSWQGSVQVQHGTELEYNYFTQSEGGNFQNILRKPGPPLHFLVPSNKSVVINDTWVWYVWKQLPFLSWGRWWEEIALRESNDQSSEVSISFRENIAIADQEEVAEPCSVEAEDVKVVGVDNRIQVEILMNSSECTMQRIAIVEDGKLVQLLLEAVYANVQVGNIYLGVVKQILPGMNGVFVDIGGSRVGLLSMNLDLAPYTFPPFGHIDSDVIEKGNGTLNSFTVKHGKRVPEAREHKQKVGEEMEGYDMEDESRDDYNVRGSLQGPQVFSQEEHTDEDHYLATRQFLSQFCNRESIEERTVNDIASQSVEQIHSSKDISFPLGVQASSLGKTGTSFSDNGNTWRLDEGMKIVVQVKKEALGKKGPRLTAFPTLAGRFLVLETRTTKVGVSKKITGLERKRLKSIAESLKPVTLGVTVRTVAAGRDSEEIEKDLARLLGTWKEVMDRADAAAASAESGVESAVPVLLHRAMGQTLRTVRDLFNDDVRRMVVDSSQSYQEVTGYLQEIAPHLCDRVELYTGNVPVFDAFNLETEIDKFSSKRVNLPNGAYLVLEETEALVSVDVNGGAGMLGQNTMQMDAVLEVNLAAARQIATELRLRDVGGIIVVDFIDMEDPEHKRLVFEEMHKAIERDPSKVAISEISEYGLMEITRKRVRPSVTCTISEPCSFCRGSGRVESPEATLSKIERAIKRHLAKMEQIVEVADNAKWPHVILRVDPVLFEYLRSRSKRRVTQLGTSLKVWISLKVALELARGQFQVSELPRAAEKWSVFLSQQKGKNNTISSNILGKKTHLIRHKYFGP